MTELKHRESLPELSKGSEVWQSFQSNDMKRSVSSVLAERRKQRLAVTPSKTSVRYVKFTPEEMAYEGPEDTSDPERFPTIARGRKEWEQFLAVKRGYVRLDPDLRKVFKDDEAVNKALRKLLEAMPFTSTRKRKSA